MDLLSYYNSTRQKTVELVNPLEIEDYVPQPVEFVSPPKWNLGHTTWFFEELVLKPNVPFYKVFHAKYNYLFNSYYQALGERIQRGGRGDLSRPTVKEVHEYRSYVDKHMQEFIRRNNLTKEIEELIVLGINHEQQHQELFLTDLKYTFSLNPLFPRYSERAFCEEGASDNHAFIDIGGGVSSVGFSGKGFSYDNELPRHRVYIQPFQIRQSLVTNEEFKEFIEDDGYSRHEFWHDEAWSILKNENISHPMYWQKNDEEWLQYTLAGLRRIENSHPMTHISYFEAAAYAQWKGMRLPSEFEWEVASERINWGSRWEWTESAYLPYPGFKKIMGAIGEYNAKFMVNQKVLRGASVATPQGHIERNTYRNFFHPHMGHQFNGIRLVK